MRTFQPLRHIKRGFGSILWIFVNSACSGDTARGAARGVMELAPTPSWVTTRIPIIGTRMLILVYICCNLLVNGFVVGKQVIILVVDILGVFPTKCSMFADCRWVNLGPRGRLRSFRAL